MDKKSRFSSVVKEHEGLIYKVATLYTNTPTDREDLTQEIVYQLWKSFDSFNEQSKLSTWMYRVAMRGVRISSTTYVEAIEDFAKRRIRFERLQKINVSFGLFVLLFIIPVFAAIQGKDVTQTAHFWTLIFPMAVAFFLAFSYWVLKSYGRILNHTEKMLSDIRS